MMDCDLRFAEIRASPEIIYLPITQCIQKNVYLADSTQATFLPTNSYVITLTKFYKLDSPSFTRPFYAEAHLTTH